LFSILSFGYLETKAQFADAGPSQTLCAPNTTTTLAGNMPDSGNFGTWSVTSGNAIIANPTLYNSTVEVNGTATLRWFISDGLGSDSEGFVSINQETVTINANPESATTCNDYMYLIASDFGYLSMNWSLESVPAGYTENISNNTSLNASLSGLINGTYSIKFEATSALGCMGSTTFDFVQNGFADIIENGDDIFTCDTFAIISTNIAPAGLNGSWSFYGSSNPKRGSANTIHSPNSNVTKVSGLSEGVNNFRWTLSNGVCTKTSDVAVASLRPNANAGPDKLLCEETYYMQAVDMNGLYEGWWQKVTNNTSFIATTDTMDRNALVQNLAENSTTIFKWTVRGIDNRNCISEDYVTLAVNNFENLIPNGGANIDACSDTVQLAATAPGVGEVGVWRPYYGNVVFQDSTSATTLIYIQKDVEKIDPIVKWVIKKNGCEKEVELRIYDQKIVANAGKDMVICAESFNLTAENGYNPNWTFVSGPEAITISEPYNPGATIFASTQGTYVFQWKDQNPYCSDSDRVNVVLRDPTKGFSDISINTNSKLCPFSEIEISVTTVGYETNVTYIYQYDNEQVTKVSENSNLLVLKSEYAFGLNVKTVGNDFGCEISENFNIPISSLDLQINVENESEPGMNDGSIYAKVFEQVDPPYTFVWNTGKTSSSVTLDMLSDLNEGYYSLEITQENGQKCTFDYDFYVGSDLDWNPNCNASAVFKETVDSKKRSVSFSLDNAPAPNAYYFWSFGDGQTSEETSPTHNYQTNGYYEVCLNAYVDEFCSESRCKFVQVGEVDCAASFSNLIDQTDKKKVIFFDESLGAIDEYSWDFGDGMNSTAKDPQHTFSENGSYLITLTVKKNSTNCVSEFSQYVQIGKDLCIANFDVVAIGVNKDSLVITNNSINYSTKVQWYWTLSNGNTYESKQLAAKFPAGFYDLCLSLYDDSTGCYAYRCKEVSVGTNQLNADFIYTVDKTTKTIEVIDKSSGTVGERYWTFGDGEYHTDAKVNHTYALGGLFEVCLYVYNPTTNDYDYDCENVQIGTTNCKSDFNAVVIDANTNSVKTMNRSSRNIQYYYWSFGDGKIDTTENPGYKYKNPGEYLVSLSVMDSTGNCFDYSEQWLTVGTVNLKAGFEQKVDVTTKKVTFSNTTKGAVGFQFWDFGDGDFSLVANPTHTYEIAGMYEVNLIVSDPSLSYFDVVTKEIQVGKIDCSAKFSAFVDRKTKKVSFINEAQGSTSLYYWEFGDGGYSTDKSPVYKYPAAGSYTASLVAANNNGCMDFYETEVLVEGLNNDVVAAFQTQIKPDSLKVIFNNKSMGRIKSYSWNFGDGSDMSKLKNPTKVYSRPGVYNVCMMAVDSFGLSDLHCTEVKIAKTTDMKDLCKAKFIYTVDSINKTVKLVDKSEGKPTAWNWSLGNGLTASTQNATATYSAAGFYMINLTITSATCTAEAYQYVNVAKGNQGIQGGFVSKKQPETNTKGKGYPVDLVGATFGAAAVYVWDFGDGVKDSTTTTPNHVYANPGTYNVCLTVKDPATKNTQTTCNTVVITATNIYDRFADANNNISVYPNPMTLQTTVKYQIAQQGKVDIVLMDITGKVISSYVNQEMQEGLHSFELKNLSIKTGVYFLQLRTNHSLKTTKLIVE